MFGMKILVAIAVRYVWDTFDMLDSLLIVSSVATVMGKANLLNELTTMMMSMSICMAPQSLQLFSLIR